MYVVYELKCSLTGVHKLTLIYQGDYHMCYLIKQRKRAELHNEILVDWERQMLETGKIDRTQIDTSYEVVTIKTWDFRSGKQKTSEHWRE